MGDFCSYEYRRECKEFFVADSPTFSRVEPRSLAAISFGAPPASWLPPFDEAQNRDGMVALSPIKRPARSSDCKSQGQGNCHRASWWPGCGNNSRKGLAASAPAARQLERGCRADMKLLAEVVGAVNIAERGQRLLACTDSSPEVRASWQEPAEATTWSIT